MPALLLVAHAPLATSLAAVARHAFPDCGARLHAVDVEPAWTLDEAEARLREALGAAGGGEALVLADVFGATPCNAALRLADGVRVRVVAGVNVPMLWRTLCYADEPLEALVTRAVAGATQGVLPVAVARPQNQTPAPRAHDQVQHHHQQ